MSAVRKLHPEYESRLQWLRAADILTHELAQRPLDLRWAKQIAEKLDPDQIGFPCVCAIPDATGTERYYAADGQHRIKAVMLALGDEQLVQCEVIRGVSLQQAAKIFRGRNTVRAVKTVDRFLVGLTAGDPECQEIAAIVQSFGLKVSRAVGDGNVSSVVSLQWIYRGEKSRGTGRNVIPLKRTLETATQAWGKTAEAMNGDVLKGLGAVILRHGDVLDYDALVHRLRQFKGGAAGLLGVGRGAREWAAGSVANGVAAVIVREYDKGRKPSNRLGAWLRGQDDA